MAINHGHVNLKDGLVVMLDAANPRSALSKKNDSNILNDFRQWTDGGTGGFSGYGANGSSSEQLRTMITDDPWGGRSVVWRTIPDSTSGADGGWNSSHYSIDRDYLYRYVVFVRRHTSGTGGTFYMGLNPAPIRNDNNASQGNPYFTHPSQSSLTQNVWYMVVAHVFPESYTGGRHPDSGWYEKTSTGWKKINDKSYGNCGTEDVRWASSTTTSNHRTYHYYTTNTSSGLEFTSPRIDKCDGTQPSLSQLMYDGHGKWNDLSGNGNHGIIQNQANVTWSSDYGGVFNFDATTNHSYVTVSGFNLNTSDNTVIVASRYTNSSSGRGRILSGNSNNWLLGHHGGYVEAHYGEGWVRNSASGSDTSWGIHVATRDHSADHASYWKNGVKLTSNSTSGSQGPNGFSIGRWHGSNNQYSIAQVGYVAAWNRVMTDTEIKAVTQSLRQRYGI